MNNDVYFTLILDPPVLCDNILWSGGGDPATGKGTGNFTTRWDSTGTYTVTVTCCGHNFSKEVTIFDIDLEITGVSEEEE